ncbi:MAG: hypothetical protein ABJI60_07675 [Kangiellaceae bacterium]
MSMHKYIMKLSLTLKLIALSVFVSGCNSDTWTEGYSMGGFERTYDTYINFEKGGRVLFTANASSELYKKFKSEVGIEVKFNGETCDKASNATFSDELLVSAKCEFELNPGRQDFEVFVYSQDAKELDLTKEEGWAVHTIHGDITMTMYE